MNAIRPIATVARVLAPRARAEIATPRFSLPEDLAASAPQAAAAASDIALGALLSLQNEEEPVRDRGARRHGRALLAELDTLHAALMGDYRKFNGLAALEKLASEPPATASDPRLRAAVQEITLRARVELARYASDR